MIQQLKIQGEVKIGRKGKIQHQYIEKNSKDMLKRQKQDCEQKLQNQQIIVQNEVKQKSQPQQYLQPIDQKENSQPVKKLKPGEALSIASPIHLKFMKEAIVSEVKEELMRIKEQEKVQKMQSQEKVIEKIEQVLKEHIQKKIKENQSQNIRQQTYLKNMIFKLLENLDRFNKNLQKLQKKVESLDSQHS